jgi:small subunit ribosomal protein S20
MPRIKSAIKRVEISERNRQYNRLVKGGVRSSIKAVFNLVDRYVATKDATVLTQIQEAMNLAFSKIDKAAKKGVIHRNTAARRKSRLARYWSAGQQKVNEIPASAAQA